MYLLKRFAGYEESEAYDAKKHAPASRLYGSTAPIEMEPVRAPVEQPVADKAVGLGCWITNKELLPVESGAFRENRTTRYAQHEQVPIVIKDGLPSNAIPLDDGLFKSDAADLDLVSTGTLVNTYTGEVLACYENQMPPPTRRGGEDPAAVKRELQNAQLRLERANGYQREDLVKTENENHLEDSDAGCPTQHQSHAYNRQVKAEMEERSGRDAFFIRDNDFAIDPIMDSLPVGFAGYTNLNRFYPTLPGTNNLDSLENKSWAPNADVLPTHKSFGKGVTHQKGNRPDPRGDQSGNVSSEGGASAPRIQALATETKRSLYGETNYSPQPAGDTHGAAVAGETTRFKTEGPRPPGRGGVLQSHVVGQANTASEHSVRGTLSDQPILYTQAVQFPQPRGDVMDSTVRLKREATADEVTRLMTECIESSFASTSMHQTSRRSETAAGTGHLAPPGAAQQVGGEAALRAESVDAGGRGARAVGSDCFPLGSDHHVKAESWGSTALGARPVGSECFPLGAGHRVKAEAGGSTALGARPVGSECFPLGAGHRVKAEAGDSAALGARLAGSEAGLVGGDSATRRPRESAPLPAGRVDESVRGAVVYSGESTVKTEIAQKYRQGYNKANGAGDKLVVDEFVRKSLGDRSQAPGRVDFQMHLTDQRPVTSARFAGTGDREAPPRAVMGERTYRPLLLASTDQRPLEDLRS